VLFPFAKYIFGIKVLLIFFWDRVIQISFRVIHFQDINSPFENLKCFFEPITPLKKTNSHFQGGVMMSNIGFYILY
jgi:hypothetical protein